MPTITLYPVADLHREVMTDTISGAEAILKTGLPALVPGSYKSYEIGIRFDGSTLPKGVKINSAVFKVYLVSFTGVSGRISNKTGIRINGGELTDSYYPSFMTSYDSMIFDETITSSDVQKWFTYDIKRLVQSGSNRSNSNLTFIYELYPTDYDALFNFSSKEAADSTKRASLTIDYELVAPEVPTNLNPSGGVSANIAQSQRLSWKHNPAYSLSQQSKIDLQWRKQGTATWNLITQMSSNQYYDFSANAFPRGVIEWQVKTYDQNNLESPWSPVALFYVVQKPSAPVITSPVNNAEISTPVPTITWTSAEQVEYNLQVLDSSNNLLWETTQTSLDKSKQVEYSLFNNSNYKIRVRIKNGDNYWSDFSEITIKTKYTDPPRPVITLQCDSYRGSIKVIISNPASTGGQPVVTRNEVYKREKGTTAWKTLSLNTQANGTVTDYFVKYNTEYEYMARAVGANTAVIESYLKTSSTVFSNAQIMLISDPSKWAELKYNPNRQKRKQYESVAMKFAGRVKPVIQHGEHIDADLSMSFEVYDQSSINLLEFICDMQETIFYRDIRGRCLYAGINELTIKDELPDYWIVSFNLIEVDYEGGL